MRVIECDMAPILDELRRFQYTTDVDGTPTTVNVELWESGMNYIVTQSFLQKHGNLKADTILELYKNGGVTKDYVGDYLKILLVNQWKHWLEMWKSQYNPLWNVDGVETRTVTTEYGKITTTTYDNTLTDEQKVAAHNEYKYGRTDTLTDEQKVAAHNEYIYGKGETLTDEQKTDGKNNITHGMKTDHTHPTTTNLVAAFDQNTYVGHDQSSATQNYDQESGTTNTAISLGKIEHKSEQEGKDEQDLNAGTMEHKNVASGKDEQDLNAGKVEHAKAGEDEVANNGKDVVTDVYERHGNIGVTMTQQLLTAEKNFWEYFNFFDMFFQSISDELTIPIYE